MLKKIISSKAGKLILGLLKEGISPKKLALSIALGGIFGLFPFVGVTTALCVLVSVVFRLNMPTMQLVNYALYPLQLTFYIPFISLGRWIFNAPPFPYDVYEVINLFEADYWAALALLWKANLMGIFAWMLIAVPLTTIFYYFSLFFLKRHLSKKQANLSPVQDIGNQTDSNRQ